MEEPVDDRDAAAALDDWQRDLAPLWSRSLGDPAVCIAVLDGPVDLEHPCFAGANLERIETLADSDLGTGLASRHGTHVASVIFGSHGSPVHGVAPGCRGLILPVFSESAEGRLVACSQLDLARAISQAVGAGANVINISGGRLDPTGEPEAPLKRAVELCRKHGVLLVASAGNDGCRCLHVPAAMEPVLVAGAMDAEGRPLASSNWGDAYRSHGVLAPGAGILGAAPTGTERMTGTSFATPIVTGIVGLLMSIQGKQGMAADAYGVRDALIATAQPGRNESQEDCQRLLAGRIDPAGALSQLFKGATSDMTTETIDTFQVPSPPAPVQTPSAEQPAASQSNCGCNGAPSAKLVYALGMIHYDFGSEARRDSLVQEGVRDPHNLASLMDHLDKQPWSSSAITWTLVQEATPIYAIQPAGPFASEICCRLREFVREQIQEGVTQVSIPGYTVGKATLLNGQTVPIVVPELRGMYSWSEKELVKRVLGDAPENEKLAAEVRNFLQRVYYELGNLGVSPQERAVNYAATNAVQAARVYHDAIQAEMKLDKIEVERSQICRPGSDCWDVKMIFFDPVLRKEKAKEIFRFTIDVSEVIPVTIGQVRRWSAY